ncbi:MAG: hypothetical protein GEU90_21940 [Gemmatimonas sp.]|nr:hypothetical protein [Gemmatimonas sp.]
MRRVAIRIGMVGLAIAVTHTPLAARQVAPPVGGERYPLAPAIQRGEGVAPFFDGAYINDDGSYTFSFGFMNRNQKQVIEIPIGADNQLTPEEFNGMQPTYFPPVRYGGFGGRRERGTFAVRVPADYEGDVVWTLSVNGKTYSVPGRTGLPAYELSYTPQASGSLMPAVSFEEDGPTSTSREGIVHGPLNARVGEPLEIEFWMADRGERDPVPTAFTWWKHQGPVGSEVTFEPEDGKSEEPGGGKASSSVTFSMPGAYLLRLRVDNHTDTNDSAPGHNCCWSNGYVRVNVSD